MSLGAGCEDAVSEPLCVNFNQDFSSLAVGSKRGYKLISLLTSIDKLEVIYENDIPDVIIVERLFSSSLVAIVSLSAPRKLQVCHFKKGTKICDYSYSNSILSVMLNRLRLVVCLEESLYIHNIRDMKVLHTISETAPNPNGLCALSTNNDNCFLAYPCSNTIGEVRIFDCSSLKDIALIPAHDNPLAALAFTPAGNRIATASEKGTVIRVFSVPEGKKIFEFRRGVKRCARIYSLAFSPDAMFLASSSNTETVHIFKLEQIKEKVDDDGTWMGLVGKALQNTANYLPANMSDMLTQGRDHAMAHLPQAGLRNRCALALVQKCLRLLVASQDGYLYIYNIHPSDGGECVLVKQHRLDGSHEKTSYADMTAERLITTHDSGVPATDGSGDDAASVPPVTNLRLDDENEFPPMMHKAD